MGIVKSPINGKAIPIVEVKDPMFSEKLLGDGVAVYPTFKSGLFAKSEPLYAPCDGEVILVFEEKHALGFRMESGEEVLIHIGIDTVELKGAPFKINCKVGDIVKQGEKIGEVNWKAIEKAGKDTIVPIIWTNNDSDREIRVVTNNGPVDSNTTLFEI